jgi:hypothetical protein
VTEYLETSCRTQKSLPNANANWRNFFRLCSSDPALIASRRWRS